ncbi:patatin-like phospholipase family protein [Micromonospora carbonacea]|uniref:Patatin-like phospholipase family protein n=1 Tax=Micromonospora carbonacea TaxID=47853 RepID=A0A7H8XJF0_9ACTN|nr:patatin-like phospholipase family protein [Micromonospora carbonacea]MBB5828453.1 putative patatin/cPLA2 family phospholipase [Micromonospora carbonacea]QLD23942.1 patatin-like phospholipase family protein [Micromonospora carbonacea]
MDDAPWLANHPVLEALRRRRRESDSPGNRSDDFKIGLAVEGGGIRGVVSGAMLCALEDLGMTAAFDAVYSASSGAINSAYFLAGGSWYPLSIYYDDLTTRKFVDFRRFFRGHILDLDYAFGVVVDQLKPLDYERVIASPVPLHIAITLADEIRTETVHDFTSRADLRSALVASAWLPVALRGTAVFRGERVVDGGVLTPHPYRIALQDGCTHVLSLSTRPIRPPRDGVSLSQRYAARHLNAIRDGLGAGYLRAMRDYRVERRMLQRRMTEPGEAPYVLDLAPLPWMPEVKRHEMDSGRVIAGARGGYEVMYCAIENRDPALIPGGRIRAVPRLTIVAKDHAQ